MRRKRRRAEAGSAGRKPLSADRAQQRQDSCDRRAQSWLEGRSGRGVERKRGRESRSTASTPTIDQEGREKEEEVNLREGGKMGRMEERMLLLNRKIEDNVSSKEVGHQTEKDSAECSCKITGKRRLG